MELQENKQRMIVKVFRKVYVDKNNVGTFTNPVETVETVDQLSQSFSQASIGEKENDGVEENEEEEENEQREEEKRAEV